MQVNQSYNLPDHELLLLLKRKDQNALSHIYDLYAPPLYGLILKKVKDEDLANQILTSTFLSIWKECRKHDCIKQRLFTLLLSLTHKTAMNDFKIDLQAYDSLNSLSLS